MIPELSQAVNGFLWMFSETPLLILEGQKWPEDNWDGGTSFSFTMSVVSYRALYISDLFRKLTGLGSI